MSFWNICLVMQREKKSTLWQLWLNYLWKGIVIKWLGLQRYDHLQGSKGEDISWRTGSASSVVTLTENGLHKLKLKNQINIDELHEKENFSFLRIKLTKPGWTLALTPTKYKMLKSFLDITIQTWQISYIKQKVCVCVCLCVICLQIHQMFAWEL